MKKIFLYSCIILFLFLLCGCILQKNFSTVKINNQEFQVEVAKTQQEKYQGLSNRKNLAENSGMLFVYNDYKVRNFVMREMNFPLDIVWIKDNLVVSCEKNIAIYDENNNWTKINSPEPVNYVLEINSGLCEKYNIQKGDRVDPAPF